MAKSKTQLEQEILLLLNEMNTSNVAALLPGTGGADVVSHTTVVDRFIDEAAADIACTLFPIPGYAVQTGVAIGTRTLRLSSLPARTENTATADGSVLWHLAAVYWEGVALQKVDVGVLANYKSDWRAPATGTPLYWYREADSLGLYPVPGVTGAATAYGLLVPPPITTTTNLSWCPDHLARLVTLKGAFAIAAKNQDDPTLGGRGPELMREGQELAQREWDKLPRDYKEGDDAPFKESPIPLVPPYRSRAH